MEGLDLSWSFFGAAAVEGFSAVEGFMVKNAATTSE